MQGDKQQIKKSKHEQIKKVDQNKFISIKDEIANYISIKYH